MSKREVVIKIDAKLLAVAVGFLALGLFGSRLSHLAGRVLSHIPHPSLHTLVPRPAGPPVEILCDFETEQEGSVWKMRGVKLTRVSEHATHGQWAGRFSYPARQEGPAALIEDALEDHKIRSDWSSYDELAFDVYNPQTHQERLILQVKDAGGGFSKQNLYLNPESSEHVSVAIADLKSAIDVTQIGQLNFFEWQPDHAATYFIDHIRLIRGSESAAPSAPVPVGSQGAPAVTPAAGFVLGVEDGATKIFREPSAFHGERTTTAKISLARNEVEAFQIALYHPETPVAKIQIERSDLLHDNGQAMIDHTQVRVRQVRYVETEKPDYPVSYVGFWPDPLADVETVTVEPNEVQPLWVTIRTNAQTPTGHYRGTITLRPPSGEPVTIQIEATVWDFGLPVTGHLKSAFDFYPSRLRRAYENWLPEAYAKWGPRMGDLEHLYFLDLLDHRISPIWSVNPATDTSFDGRVSQYLDRGLTAFGVGSHGGSFDNDWPVDQTALDTMASSYRNMALLLQRRGLLDKAYVYTYDEPPVGHPPVAQATSAIHWADPGLKNLVVLHDLSDPTAQPGWWKDIDIVCVRNTAVTEKYLNILRQWGKDIWLYVSGPSHPYPTLVLDYPAMAARILPWMCWKAGADGLLYWSVNYWTKNPWEDPQNTKWGQNANGSLMYPGDDGPVDSIRMEALRDGMEDYEYLYLLKQVAARVKASPAMSAPSAQGLVAKAEQLLAIDPKLIESMRSYSQSSGVLQQNRAEIAGLIEALQRL